MSYVVRKIGGGSYNPKAMCTSCDNCHLFIACGCQINIYHIPGLEELDTITTHKAHVTAIVCNKEYLISADCEGNIYWHKFNSLTIIDKEPFREFHCEFPIERLLLRSDKLFYVYFNKKLFWLIEYENGNESLFRVNSETQKILIENLHQSVVLSGIQPLRFTTLDGFDINEEATTAAIVDKCKLHIFDFSTGKHEVHPTQTPIAYVRFRNNSQAVTFLANGQMFIYGGKGRTPVRDHWHYACPNSFAATDTTVISGGFEGVLTFYNELRHCHEHVPRLGISIEGIALTPSNNYVCVQFDKNMLAVVDATGNHSLIASRSLITGNIHFTEGKLISIRQPNLVQIFDCKTSNVMNQLQVSSFHSNVPLTGCEVGDEYMITVETAGIKAEPKLTVKGMVTMIHKKPIANKQAHDIAYEKALLKDKYSAMKAIKRIKYGNKDEEEEAIVDDGTVEREGNPLMKDPDATNSAEYSEIKIWHLVNNKYQLEQSFRCIGKTAQPISIHPTLKVFAIVISHELQIWKRADNEMWEMTRSTHLPIIPHALRWSKDGTILVAQYNKRIDLMDAETLSVAATHQLESIISVAKFINDFEIAIQTKLGVHIFDIRTLTETKIIFAQSTCGDITENAFVFVLNKQQPVVVLYDEGKMVSWQVPTLAPVKGVHIIRVNGRCAITAVDEDNFLWGIDEFGFEEKKPAIALTITAPKPRQIKKLAKAAIKTDHVAEIAELLKVSSHQIYDGIEEAFFEIVLASRTRQEAASIPVKIEETTDETVPIDASTYTPVEINDMRQAFTF